MFFEKHHYSAFTLFLSTVYMLTSHTEQDGTHKFNK